MARSLGRLPLPSFLVWNPRTDEVAIQQSGLIIESFGEISLIDKNSLWGILNIQKGELCVKEVFAKFYLSGDNNLTIILIFHIFGTGIPRFALKIFNQRAHRNTR